MINFEIVPKAVYHNTLEVSRAIEELNRHGYSGILDSIHEVPHDGLSVPLECVNPISRHYEPLQEFADGLIVNAYGMANGHSDNTRVMNALIAEVTGMPVIGVALPNRDWFGTTIPDVTKHWSSHSPKQKELSGIRQLDLYADHVLELVEEFVGTSKGPGKLHVFGGSAGSAVGLSVAHQARQFDTGNVSVMAIPNVERRPLYRKLLADFVRSGGGMPEMVQDGPIKFKPLVEKSGFETGPKTKAQMLAGGVGFLMHDLFGLWPVDPKLRLPRTNISLARPLTVPTGLQMIERLEDKSGRRRVNAGFLELDAVARYKELIRLGADHSTPKHAEFQLFEGVGHAACNNPYIVGYMASLLVDKN